MKKKILLATVLFSISLGLYGCSNSPSTKEMKPEKESVQDENSSTENTDESTDKNEQKDSTNKESAEKSTNTESKDSKNTSENKYTITYYTYDINTEKLKSHTAKVDEISVGNIVAQLKKEKVIPSTSSVNSAKVVDINGVKTIKVDMNSDFVDRNLGSSAEALYLQSFANSLIDTFKVKQVKLTIDGKGYSGSHIALDDNQYLQYK